MYLASSSYTHFKYNLIFYKLVLANRSHIYVTYGIREIAPGKLPIMRKILVYNNKDKRALLNGILT